VRLTVTITVGLFHLITLHYITKFRFCKFMLFKCSDR